MSDYFNEERMLESLAYFVPEGETLIAAVKAIGNSMEVRQCFSYVTVMNEETLCRSEEQPDCVYDIQRCKYATHDIYIGFTENYIVFNECDIYKHAYVFEEAKPGEFVPMEVTGYIRIADFGHAQADKDVLEVKIKKGFMGAQKCMIKYSNGSCFQFSIPKKAGTGNGMPHHTEYTEKLIAKLNSLIK